MFTTNDVLDGTETITTLEAICAFYQPGQADEEIVEECENEADFPCVYLRQTNNHNLDTEYDSKADINVFVMTLPHKDGDHEIGKIGWDVSVPASDDENEYKFTFACTADDITGGSDNF